MRRDGDERSSGVLVVRTVAGPGDPGCTIETELRVVARGEGAPAGPPGHPRVDGVLLLTDIVGSSGILIVDGTVRTLTPSPVPAFERVEHEMEPLRRARIRAEARRASAERLLLTAERLTRGTRADAVVDAALDGATDVVGGFGALYWDGGRWYAGSRLARERLALPVLEADAPKTPSLRTRAAPGYGSAEASWSELFSATGADSMACVPLGPLGTDGFLAVVERRASRVFEPEAWDGLRAVARHAEAALERLELRRATGVDPG